MKWILKLIIAGLAAGVLVYLFHLYPFAWSLLLHRPPGWLSTLLTDYIQAIETPAGRPDPFLVVIFSLALLLLVSLHLKLLSRTTNYGSAGFMGWLEAGRFAAPIFSGLLGLLLWVLRVPFFLVVVTLKGVGVLGHGIHVHQQNVQIGKAPAASRFVIGTFQGRTIFLSTEQQQEHVLMTAPTGTRANPGVYRLRWPVTWMNLVTSAPSPTFQRLLVLPDTSACAYLWRSRILHCCRCPMERREKRPL